MIEPVTIALVTSVLSGLAGSVVDAQIVLHAPTQSIVWVEGVAVPLAAGETRTVHVPVNISVGRSEAVIAIVSDGVTNELRVTTVGRRDVHARWWLPLGALPLVLASVRVRRTTATSRILADNS